MSFAPRAAPVIDGSNWRRGREREASFAAWSAIRCLSFSMAHTRLLSVLPSSPQSSGIMGTSGSQTDIPAS